MAREHFVMDRDGDSGETFEGVGVGDKECVP